MVDPKHLPQLGQARVRNMHIKFNGENSIRNGDSLSQTIALTRRYPCKRIAFKGEISIRNGDSLSQTMALTGRQTPLQKNGAQG